jgi:hypothetical protein
MTYDRAFEVALAGDRVRAAVRHGLTSSPQRGEAKCSGDAE